jgi:thiosulfate reductase cytochrome b subunit
MKRLEKKHPLAIRWFHWINFPVLFLMIWSGILIYWANDVYRIGIGSWTLFKFFPPSFYQRFNIPFRLGEGMAWHFVFAWVFAINGLLYVLYVLFSGEWRHLLPRRETLREAIHVVLHDLKIRKAPLPRAKFNGAQRIAYTGVIVMGFGSFITGLAIYKPIQTAGIFPFLSVSFLGATGYEISRWVHFWLTWAFCAFFLVHIAQVARAGWNNFRAMITGYEIVTDDALPPTAAPVSPAAPSHENDPKPAAIKADPARDAS